MAVLSRKGLSKTKSQTDCVSNPHSLSLGNPEILLSEIMQSVLETGMSYRELLASSQNHNARILWGTHNVLETLAMVKDQQMVVRITSPDFISLLGSLAACSVQNSCAGRS